MEAEIIILGAGPAGLSAALHLARSAPGLAARTLILEKDRHPRPKVCAGGLLPDGERILRRLGLDVTAVPHVDVDWARFHFAGRGGRMRAGDGLAFRVFRRAELDAWLAEQVRRAGIPILEETAARSARRVGEEMVVETDGRAFRARALIGADGSAGLARRIVHGRHAATARALEVPVPADGLDRDARFEFLPVAAGLAGYLWDFPAQIDGQPMRCLGIYDSNLGPRTGRQPLREILAGFMKNRTLSLDDFPLRAHPIHCFHPRNPLSAPGVVLAGDAAGADVLLGEGISPALGWGELAAHAVADAFARNDFSFRAYRRKALLSPLGQTLIMRRFLANILYSLRAPWVQKLLWRGLDEFLFLVARLLVIDWA